MNVDVTSSSFLLLAFVRITRATDGHAQPKFSIFYIITIVEAIAL